MKKIELSSIESKNMTAAPEEILSEVNGGCTFEQRSILIMNCSGSYYTKRWVAASNCGKNCPSTLVDHFMTYYAKDYKDFDLSNIKTERRPNTGNLKVWWVGPVGYSQDISLKEDKYTGYRLY